MIQESFDSQVAAIRAAGIKPRPSRHGSRQGENARVDFVQHRTAG
jgi:hypothetical protein